MVEETMSSNLPPGVSDSMLPGNRPEDSEWEKLHEYIDMDCETEAWDPLIARWVWDIGSAAYRKVVCKAIEQAVQQFKYEAKVSLDSLPPIKPISVITKGKERFQNG